MSLRILPSHRPDRSQHPLIVRLSSGFRRFQHRWYHPDEPLFQELKSGQNPLALVIACSDSRVDPALLTDSRPGDLFILRNVANLVHPYVPEGGALSQNAAIEYAVKHLKVQDIIVMGHACCGGIKALVSARARILAGESLPEADEDEFIGPWVSVAVKALEKAEEGRKSASLADMARACELWSVRLSLENLLTFPWVKEAVAEGRLALHGWYFDLQSGELLEFDPKEQAFRPLVGRPHGHEGETHHERRPRAEHWEAHGDALWAHYDCRSMEDSGSHRAKKHERPHEHHREHLPREPHGHVRGKHH